VQIDPSPLRAGDVTDWKKLLLAVRTDLASDARRGEFLAARCPIMGGAIDLSNIPAELTRGYQGGKVGFCCAGCPEKWDALSEDEKQAKLAKAKGETPIRRFWSRLSGGLREALLATVPDERPAAGLRLRFLVEANEILRQADFRSPDVWQSDQLPKEAQRLLSVGAGALPAAKRTRLNRLLLEAAFPIALARGSGGPTFDGRQIVLGERAGSHYLVRAGLREGERIVVRGNFKIDSALQILAKPSMMLPDGGGGGGGHDHGGHGKATTGPGRAKRAVDLPAMFRHQLGALVTAAKKAHEAVAAGKLPQARAAFAAMGTRLEAVDATQLEGEAALAWKDLAMRLGNDVAEGSQARTIDRLRRADGFLKENIASLRARFPVAGDHGAMAGAAVSQAFRKQLAGLLDAYLAMQRALAADKVADAVAAAKKGKLALAAVDMKLVTGDAHMAWMKHADALGKALTAAETRNIQSARQAFSQLSRQMSGVARRFGPIDARAVYEMHCPMAFDNRGANWLQDHGAVSNPYFGSVMPVCGKVVEVISPGGAPATKPSRGDHAHD
jgi:hypothetical protein